jgi:hypothetical protein
MAQRRSDNTSASITQIQTATLRWRDLHGQGCPQVRGLADPANRHLQCFHTRGREGGKALRQTLCCRVEARPSYPGNGALSANARHGRADTKSVFSGRQNFSVTSPRQLH